MRSMAAEPFDETTHAPLLEELWKLAGIDSPFQRTSERWLRLGFQGSEPATDLRGAGVLGVRHLLHFFASGRGLVIIRENEAATHMAIPLAAASLNITHMLCSHLHLLEQAVPNVPSCSACTLVQFLRLAASCPSVLALIHSELLSALAERWRALGRADAALTLMHFPEQLGLIRSAMARALAEAPRSCIWTLPTLLMAVRFAGVNEARASAMGSPKRLSSPSARRSSRHGLFSAANAAR